MLIFSGSFQLNQMIPERNATRLIKLAGMQCMQRRKKRKRDKEREREKPLHQPTIWPKTLGVLCGTHKAGSQKRPAFGAQTCAFSACVARDLHELLSSSAGEFWPARRLPLATEARGGCAHPAGLSGEPAQLRVGAWPKKKTKGQMARNTQQTKPQTQPPKQKHTASEKGWRGPWAAPCLQGIVLGDRSGSEAAETPPATGTAHQSRADLGPRRNCPDALHKKTHKQKLLYTDAQTSTLQRAHHIQHTHTQRLRAVSRGDHVEVVGHTPCRVCGVDQEQ